MRCAESVRTNKNAHVVLSRETTSLYEVGRTHFRGGLHKPRQKEMFIQKMFLWQLSCCFYQYLLYLCKDAENVRHDKGNVMDKEVTILIVCVVYFVAMIAIGLYSSKRNKHTSDYLVAGRKLNVLMVAVTVAAVQIGVGIVLGSASNGYADGLWPGTYYAIGCGGGLVVAGWVTAGKLRRQEGYVPLDYFAHRYGESRIIRLWAWLSNIPSLLGIYIAQLIACGSILSGFGISYEWAIVLTTVAILAYCAIGGMWGVVLTNMLQTGFIVVGIPVLLVAVLTRYMDAGGCIESLINTPFIPEGLFSRFVYLVVPFLLSISVSYDVYSRIQSAKNARTASVGCIVGGILVIIIGLMCSTIGAAARVLFPGVTDGIFTVCTTSVLSPVLAGIVIASILAAAMSSANGVILSLGASFSRDFYNKFLHPEENDLDNLPKSKLVSQVTVLAGSLVALFFAFHMTDILDAMIIFNYPYMGSMLVPLLGGLVWKGATVKGAYAAAIAGGIIGVVAFLCGIPGPLHGRMNIDLSLLLAYVVSAVFLVVFSLFDRRYGRNR